MLSYKHGFHAGNHADVLKHVCLIYFIKSIKKQYNSIIYVDTHAGGGIYNFNDAYMKKNQEYNTGIGKIENYIKEDPYIKFYLKTLKNINENKKKTFYPGSPKIAEYLTDNNDELYFFELHNNEFIILKKNFRTKINIKISKLDGFNFFNERKLNIEKKGVILIDPSYEIKDDFENVIKFVQNHYELYKNKIVIIWYPILNREYTNEFIEKFKKTGIKDILRIEMPIKNDSIERGMSGSGLIVLNTHQKTAQSLRGTVKEIQDCLQLEGNKKRVIVNFLR